MSGDKPETARMSTGRDTDKTDVVYSHGGVPSSSLKGMERSVCIK